MNRLATFMFRCTTLTDLDTMFKDRTGVKLDRNNLFDLKVHPDCFYVTVWTSKDMDTSTAI